MDAAGLGVVTSLFERVDGDIARDPTSGAEHARALFGELDREGGTVATLEPPRIAHAPAADLGTWTGCPWSGPTYGLDASTTRPIEFTNGLVMDTGYAKLGVAGTDADRSVEERGTVKTVVHHDDGEPIETASTATGTVEGELVRFPAPERSPRLSRRIATAAQHCAESAHLRETIDSIDGPAFVDGSVYPLGVLYWLLLDQLGRESPATHWDRAATIVRDRIACVDRLHERGLPLIGVVKTSTLDAVVSALEDVIDAHDIRHDGRRPAVPWTRDHQFAREALRFDSANRIAYTSWLVQRTVTVGGRSFESPGPLREFGDADLDAYRRAFFYVRVPRNGDVFRIEAPRLMVDDPDRRETVRLTALREIARTNDVPRAIGRADRLARITPGNRETIRRSITSCEYARDYNWDGRWDDIHPANHPDPGGVR